MRIRATHPIWFLTGLLCFFTPILTAQNHLKVGFKDAASAPRNLHICGNEARVVVTVATEGSSNNTRQNLRAALMLFKGVEFVRFDPTASSAGVGLISGGSVPVFQLPNMTPVSTTDKIDIAYVVRVNCGYTDTLALNDRLTVVDTWTFNYDLGAQTGLSELDFSTEYRDQIKVPFFTMAVSNNASNGAAVGQTYTRRIVVSNTALEGAIFRFQYQNSQGPGFTVEGITVNGQSATVGKQPAFNANGDTLVTVAIEGALLRGNTRTTGGAGNTDTVFDANEVVTIIETIRLVNCTRSRNSTHTMSWGCDNRFCNVLSRQEVVRLSQGTINTTFRASGTVPNIVGGYCKNGQTTVTFTNTGTEIDPGAALMRNVAAGIGFGSTLLAQSGAYRIDSIRVAGIVWRNPSSSLVVLDNNPLLTTDPDGANVGLSDGDGDGFFDDLAIGRSIEATAYYSLNCADATYFCGDQFCSYSLETAFNAELDYTDACARRQFFVRPRYFAPVNTVDFAENCADPDALTDEKPFSIMHSSRRSVFNFEKNCNGQEQILVKVKVPTGITPVRDSMRFMRFAQSFPLLSLTQSNDTVYMAFDASGTPFINGDYDLNLGFKAGCTAAPAPTQFPIEIAYYCPPCDCRHPYYIDTIQGPRIHYAAPPCPPNAAYDCVKGVKTLSFAAERSTLGYADAAYTTKISPSAANLKSALSCDSVKMTVKSIVGQTPLADSIGLRISYDNVAATTDNKLKDIFIFGKGTLQITHNGRTTLCAIDSSRARYVRQDTTKFMYIDWQSCLAEAGISALNPGDSLNFTGYFMVNPDGPYRNIFEKIPNLRAYAYHIDNGAEWACDDWGVLFEVGKSQAVFSAPSSANMPQGCNPTTLNYQLLMVNNGYFAEFGDEFRKAIKVDSLMFQFDPNLLKSFSTSVDVAVTGHPIHGNNYFALPNLDSTGRYILRFDTLDIVPSLNRITNFAFDFRIKLVPNCQALTGSSNGNAQFVLSPKIWYNDRYYAREIGDGSCALARMDSSTVPVTYSNPPVLSVTALTSPEVTVADDTAAWRVQVCNTSARGQAGVNWLAIAPGPSVSDFKVASVRDITDPAAPINFTLRRYGADSAAAYVLGNGLAAAVFNTNLNDICNIYEIKTIVPACGTSRIDIRTGWFCEPPVAQWNPTQYPPCVDNTLQGTVIKSAPFIDASYINQSLSSSGLCDTTTLEILLRNTDLGIVYDMTTHLTLPLIGAHLVPNSIEMAYPSSAPYVPVVRAPTVEATTPRGVVYAFNDFSGLNAYLHQYGLKGVNANAPSDSNEFKIRYRFTTDCGFQSGVLSYYNFVGKTSCGTNTNNDAGESLPLQVSGSQLDTPKLYTVQLDTTARLTPSGQTVLSVVFTNTLATPSDSRDKIAVTLPQGVFYVPNSSQNRGTTAWVPGEPRIDTVAGLEVLTWAQPLNLGQNQSATLHFGVRTADTLPCDGSTKEIGVVTLAEKDLLCANQNIRCRIAVVTTFGGARFFNLTLRPDSVRITAAILNGNVIQAQLNDTVRLVASGATRYEWRLIADNSLLGTDSVLNFVVRQPTNRLVVRPVGANISACLTESQVLITTERDTVAPTINTRDTLVACTDTFPLVRPSVQDNFDPQPQLSYTDSLTSDSCQTVLRRTWTALDRFGNSRSVVQILTKRDTSKPVFTLINPALIGRNKGDTVRVDCRNLPTFALNSINMTDDCALNLNISFQSDTVLTDCNTMGYTALQRYVWRATDNCGNTDSFFITVALIDTVPPQLIGVPNDTVIRPGTPLPTASVMATDACTQTTVSLNTTAVLNGVDSIFTRVWTATDGCGNRTQATQVIRQTNDTLPPCGTLFPTRNIALNVANCQDSAVICLNYPLSILSKYDVSDNNTPILRLALPCDSNATQTRLAVVGGNHQYIFSLSNRTCADTLNVNVQCPPDTIIAVNDTLTARKDTVVSIFVLRNDTIGGTVTRFAAVQSPRYGNVEVLFGAPEYTFQYTPNPRFCGQRFRDTFTYEVCNGRMCDTAVVAIKVDCDGFLIYNGFSPNEDGINDVFFIDGIGDFPNTQVQVYNRWGNLIFQSFDYKNDWYGTWEDGQNVPDGTYYYRVILEKGDVFSGYLQIRR